MMMEEKKRVVRPARFWWGRKRITGRAPNKVVGKAHSRLGGVRNCGGHVVVGEKQRHKSKGKS